MCIWRDAAHIQSMHLPVSVLSLTHRDTHIYTHILTYIHMYADAYTSRYNPSHILEWTWTICCESLHSFSSFSFPLHNSKLCWHQGGKSLKLPQTNVTIQKALAASLSPLSLLHFLLSLPACCQNLVLNLLDIALKRL